MDALSIIPASPDSKTPVTISFVWPAGCILDDGLERAQNTFNIHINYSSFCFAAPPGGGVANVSIGILAPGSYNVVYKILVDGVTQQTYTSSFEVSLAAGSMVQVPALEQMGFIVLALAMVFVATKRFVIVAPTANYSLKRTAADGLR